MGKDKVKDKTWNDVSKEERHYVYEILANNIMRVTGTASTNLAKGETEDSKNQFRQAEVLSLAMDALKSIVVTNAELMKRTRKLRKLTDKMLENIAEIDEEIEDGFS